MTTFALIHGGGHGAWCWERVQRALAQAGHVGVAIDAPIEDETNGASDWARAVVESLAAVDEPVVIVGHSLGGLVVPLIAAMRPTSRMIFLSAALPRPGKSYNDQRQEEPDITPPYVGENNGLNKERFYNTCSPEDADWAMSRLRHQSPRIFEEVTPLTAWPAIPADYIVSTEDHAISPDWGRRAARERLGTEAHVIVGSDHSPMLNRPAEVAQLLIALSEQVPSA